MDLSMWIGVLGIVVSVLVGWATYKFADRRGRNQRYLAAKATVLQELSKALGEDSVPTPTIIRATIGSVLRESGDAKLEIEIEDVLDDLMRQVTADPFLERDRRRKLQSDIELVRSEILGLGDFARIHSEYEYFGSRRSSVAATFVGAFATLLSAMAMATVFTISVARERSAESIVTIREIFVERGMLEWMLAVPVFIFIIFLVLRLVVERTHLRKGIKKFLRNLNR